LLAVWTGGECQAFSFFVSPSHASVHRIHPSINTPNDVIFNFLSLS
jgi:hypothetical protein